MKLLGDTRNRSAKDEIGKNVPQLESTEIVVVRCDIVNSNYQRGSRAWYTFAPNKSFGHLLDISSKVFMFVKMFHSEFPYIELWFTDKNYEPLDTKDKINIIVVIN